MSLDLPGLQWTIQGGALGLLAYLIVWITRRLNGELGRLREAVERNTAALHALADALRGE